MPRILIADDIATNAELIEANLDNSDYEIRIAANGEETIHIAREWQPDVILLDVMMPKLSGFEVCKMLRADASTANIGILMITALDQVTDIERAVEAGTDDFLTKPVHKSELILRLKAMLAARKETASVERGLAYFRNILQGA